MSADIHGLVGAYAVDAIDEQERSAFELHLAECPECQAEVASLQQAATQLSLNQTQLQAALQVTAGLHQLSLLNFLKG